MQFEKNRYKYRLNLFILFVSFGLFISIILYFILYYKNLHLLEQNYKELAEKKIEFKINLFQNEIVDLKKHLLSLKENSIFQNYINNKEIEKENISNLFLFTLNANREFFQIRYIDKLGQELIRVDKDKLNGVSKVSKNLQNKFDRYYFKEILNLKENEVYLSNFDLNIEYGKVEIPYKPTIRIATPIYINNKLDGILIINKFEQKLLEAVEVSNFFNIYLIDKDGYFNIHKDENKSWSKDLKTFYNIKDEFPNFYQEILNHSYFETNSLFSKHIDLDIENLTTPYHIAIILEIKNELIQDSIDKIKFDGFIIGVVILILCIPLSVIASSVPEKLYMKLIKQGEELKNSMKMIDKYICYSKTDKNGTIIEASSAFCKNSEYSKSEIIGKTHALLRHPDNDDNFYINLWSTIKSGQIWQNEIKNLTKSKKTIYDFSTIIPQKDENGEIVGYISIRQDVTDKKKIEEQKLQLLTQSKHAAMGEMVSIIAHQWRQPLNVLSLKLFSIFNDFQNKKLSSDSMEKYYEESYDIINEMSKIIETFRNFFKNKTLQEVSIDEVIKDTFKFIDNILIVNNINFIYTKNSNLKVKAIKNELIQVLLNIFKNSIDELKMKDIKDKFIKVKTSINRKYIIISIIDNAGGVKDEFIKKIFEPYFSTKSENGTGIGLYMCKLIIEESLNGKICAKNENDGLKITIRIPKES